jgi:hypothetical protein
MEGAATVRFELMFAFLLVTGSVAAQGSDTTVADALFREARALMKKGDFKAACPKLVESQKLDPAPGTAINLGDCWEKLGLLADALQARRDALDLLRGEDNRVPLVRKEIAALEQRVPKLTITLASTSPPATKVLRDEIELGPGSLRTALPVNPGKHTIVVTAPRYKQRRYELELAEKESTELVVEVGEKMVADSGPPTRSPATTTPAPMPDADTAEGSSLTTAGLVVGAIGLAAGAFGGVALYQAHQYKGRSDDAPAGSERDDLYKTAELWQTASIVSFIAGGGAVLTGIVLVFSSRSAPGGRSVNVGISPAGIGAATIAIEGTW